MPRSRDKCPFNKKNQCHECRLQRRGTRYIGIEQRKEEYAECVFNCMCDNLEEDNLALRAVQAEVGQTKQAAIFQALAILADSAQAKDELKRLIVRNFEGLQSLLGVAARKTTSVEDLLDLINNEVGDVKDANRQITD